MPKTVNYSAELTAQIIEDYQNGSSVEEISSAIGKSLRSVRSKLVREGVYIAQEKTKSNKPKEPTKISDVAFTHYQDFHWLPTADLETGYKMAINRELNKLRKVG